MVSKNMESCVSGESSKCSFRENYFENIIKYSSEQNENCKTWVVGSFENSCFEKTDFKFYVKINFLLIFTIRPRRFNCIRQRQNRNFYTLHIPK